jgi:hypothetical protein
VLGQLGGQGLASRFDDLPVDLFSHLVALLSIVCPLA